MVLTAQYLTSSAGRQLPFLCRVKGGRQERYQLLSGSRQTRSPWVDISTVASAGCEEARKQGSSSGLMAANGLDQDLASKRLHSR